MKLAGHTMGTPEYTLPEAIQLFSTIGLDGIEIILQTDGYQCALSLFAGEDEIEATKRLCQQAGLAIPSVTPYMNLFNSLDEDERLHECQLLCRAIDVACRLGASTVRVYGGKLVTGDEDHCNEKLDRLVQSMRYCGDYARPKGIKLCLENHFGTMTTSAKITSEIVHAIDHPNVGILYDQANLAFFPAEEYKEAIALQRDKIFFVHVKDLVYRGEPKPLVCSEVSHISEEERTVHSRIPGEGILDWPAILQCLKDSGYDGWLSLEYERRWQTIDLPEASVGMRQACRTIKQILSNLV